MARPKKPNYEYVEKLNLFRKRVQDIHGKYVAVYGALILYILHKKQRTPLQSNGALSAR